MPLTKPPRRSRRSAGRARSRPLRPEAVGSTAPLPIEVGSPPFNNGPLSGALSRLRVRGALLLNFQDRVLTLKGVTVRALELASPIGSSYAPPITDAELALLVDVWGANAITVPIAQNLALEGTGAALGSDYVTALDATIAAAATRNAYTIIQLSVLSSVLPTGSVAGTDVFDPKLPESPSSTDLWAILAQRYAGESAVIFDLFRSPHDPSPDEGSAQWLPRITWETWRRHCLQMIGEIRLAGQTAPIIVRGLGRGTDLSGFPLRLSDGSSVRNVIYAAELGGGSGDAVFAQLRALKNSGQPVGVFTWWTSRNAAEVSIMATRLGSIGAHWISGDWTGSRMPLVIPHRNSWIETPAGRAFRAAMRRVPASRDTNYSPELRDGLPRRRVVFA